MRITFLLPGYPWVPSGGFRVVYEYANQLAARGHQVNLVHPLRVNYDFTTREKLTFRGLLRKIRIRFTEATSTPSIDWHSIDSRVNVLFVPNSDSCHIPDGDALFATAWHTVRSVLECSRAKGAKCYLIQHYETWLGSEALVAATWRAPLHKVVVSRWLVQVGETIGCTSTTYIPNAIDHCRYRVTKPIEHRPRKVAMLFSKVSFKGAADGLAALEIAKRKVPDLQVVLFGVGRRPGFIPKWMTYFHNPPQEFIVENIYNGSSIIMSSSLSEGFALPPAEGAACGCAIVATDSGGIRDFVEHDVTGLLSSPGDPAALAANLCRVLADEDLRIRLATAARDRVAQLTWEHSADSLEEFISNAVCQQLHSSSTSLIDPEPRVFNSLQRETSQCPQKI